VAKAAPRRAARAAGDGDLLAPAAAARSQRAAEEIVNLDLFERLRVVRRRLADAEGVPAYIVFSDAVLREMAKHAPQTRAELLAVSGVGRRSSSATARPSSRSCGRDRSAGSGVLRAQMPPSEPIGIFERVLPVSAASPAGVAQQTSQTSSKSDGAGAQPGIAGDLVRGAECEGTSRRIYGPQRCAS